MKVRPVAPAPLVQFVSNHICGKDDDDEGYADRRTNALRRASEIQDSLDDLPRCPDHPTAFCADDRDYADSLLQMQAADYDEADYLAVEIETLLRLVDDDRMGEAYELLSEQFNDDTSWPLFAQSALMARRRYSEYRKLEKESAKLASEISQSSRVLAKLIRQLQNTGVALPSRLRPQHKDGDLISFGGASREARHLQMVQMIYHRQNPLPAGTPNLTQELLGLAEDLEKFVPDLMCPALRAAAASRQISEKTSYIRAFCADLEECRIAITPSVKRAMAITATEIFGDTELEFSEDEVRKAIDRQKDRRERRTTRKPKRS